MCNQRDDLGLISFEAALVGLFDEQLDKIKR